MFGLGVSVGVSIKHTLREATAILSCESEALFETTVCFTMHFWNYGVFRINNQNNQTFQNEDCTFQNLT